MALDAETGTSCDGGSRHVSWRALRHPGGVVGVARDLLSSLAELTHRIQQEQATLRRAVARGREVRTGTDESGTIIVELDDEGTARDVRVGANWRYRLSLVQVGPAVVAADASAALRRANATIEALDQSTADSGRSTQDGQTDGLPAGGCDRPDSLLPPPRSGAAATSPRRSVAEISAAVLAAVNELDGFTEPPPPVHGTGADGAVRVTLVAGRITECAISPAWLRHQDEVTLARALREAVGQAAAAGVAARTRFMDYQRRLEALVADARASLNDLARGVRS